jgi:L-asparaginase II
MLNLAKQHEWELDEDAVAQHPVQRNCLSVISQLCDIDATKVGGAVDGCGVVSWALPLRALATGYARLATADGPAQAVVSAMTTHPDLVAGKRRLCTALMQAYPGKIITKVGAGGVYGASVLDEGLGIAIKVLDGDAKAASVALLTVLSDLGINAQQAEGLTRFASPVILNTNREVVGRYEAVRN